MMISVGLGGANRVAAFLVVLAVVIVLLFAAIVLAAQPVHS